jgi:hypothetical protein
MSKFSTISQGTRATKPLDLPPPIGAGEGTAALKCLLRPLNGIEEGVALERARADAVKAGVAKPAAGEPEYDLALQAHTIALGCSDPDAPAELFFDGGADQVREHYGREAIAYIYELHLDWQDRCSPTLKNLNPDAWIAGVVALGGPDEEAARHFFYRLRPGLRWSYTHTLAVQQANSLLDSSPSGSSSEASGISEKKTNARTVASRPRKTRKSR